MSPEPSRGEALKRARARLKAAGLAEAEADARLLFMEATGLALLDVLTSPEAALDAEVTARLDAMLARRESGEPVGRILGWREFWGMRFDLSPATLEPRPDTETLVEAALAALDGRRDGGLAILDLGTGTGCLLAALLAELPQARGTGVDLSREAAATARGNLRRLGFAARAEVVQGGWEAAQGRFDLVVSNPPYIPAAEIAGLAREVSGHDPHLALDGGPDGLDAYRAIAAQLLALLVPAGVVVLEIGAGQGEDVRGIMTAAGLRFVASRADLAGVERALVFRIDA